MRCDCEASALVDIIIGIRYSGQVFSPVTILDPRIFLHNLIIWWFHCGNFCGQSTLTGTVTGVWIL